MKKVIGFCAVLAVFAVNAMAGPECCGFTKGKSGSGAKVETLSAKDGQACGPQVFTQLNLTDEQKAQLVELKGECDKEACSITGYGKFMTGAKEILTADQLAKCVDLCDENGWQCPVKTTAESTEKQAES